MSLNSFLFRQGQRMRYHFAGDLMTKRIAEINRHERNVTRLRDGFWLTGLQMFLPKKFEFILQKHVLDWFLRLPKDLDGRYVLENDRLFFRFRDLNIEITSKSELFIMNEIFVEGCYDFLMPKGQTAHVVDIGMNVGLASLFFAGLPFVSRVHSYEPFPTTFEMAKSNLRNNPGRAEKIEMHNAGLGSTDAEIHAPYDSENKGVNASLVAWQRGQSNVTEKLKIQPAFETLNTLFRKFPSDNFILKIDTEGAEYEIIRSLFQGPLTRQVKGIMLEWHFRGSEELASALTDNGFIVTSFGKDVNSGMLYGFR